MARIRSIKPEFWTSAQILECSPNSRLLFIGLWNFCDDYGRHPYSPKQCKAEVFPSDKFTDDDIEAMLFELEANELISVYGHENTEYFYVTGWDNQRIDKPQKPKYPDPFDEHSEKLPRTFPPDKIGEDKIREERKERKQDSSLRSDVNGNGQKSYAFSYRGMNLTEKDFNQWKKAYPCIDLQAELTAIADSDWFITLGSKWFSAVSSLLNKRNRKVKSEQTKPAREVADFNDPEWRARHAIDGIG